MDANICEQNAIQFANSVSLETLNSFLNVLPNLNAFEPHHPGSTPKIKPKELQMMYKIQFFCALRIGEARKLIIEDFDLKHRIIYIRDPKTKKGGVQKTTIPPPLIADLEGLFDYVGRRSINSLPLFQIGGTAAWKYCKEGGELANLNIFEELENRSIEGMFTHIFRKSYAKFMEEAGATPSLIMLKGRWKPSAVYQFYTKPSLMTLLNWESKIFPNSLESYRTIF